jgi:hypothetical protein
VSAALHLAEVHQAPPGPKRKRKGGGGNGGEFYEYAQRIYADDRADGGARALLLALAYAVTTAHRDDGPGQWALVKQALGRGRGGQESLSRLIRDDAPRYVPPQYQQNNWDVMLRICSAPRLRPYRSRPWLGATAQDIAEQAKRDAENVRNVKGICGATASEYAVEKLPGTGWHRLHYFCAAHAEHLDRVRKQVAAQNELAPAPIPNAGGLLPSYFTADWETVYRSYRGEHWNPPVYGMAADDWPIPGREPVAPRARLRLAALDGELLGGAS